MQNSTFHVNETKYDGKGKLWIMKISMVSCKNNSHGEIAYNFQLNGVNTAYLLRICDFAVQYIHWTYSIQIFLASIEVLHDWAMIGEMF